jgi:hypothetical protein
MGCAGIRVCPIGGKASDRIRARMALFLLRSGRPVAVPDAYAAAPEHQALVARLTSATTYAEAVEILNVHADSYLAADVLTGAPWAQKFLLTTARLHHLDKPLARAGLRALMRVLNGTKPQTGRHRVPPLLPAARGTASAALGRWQSYVDTIWSPDRAVLASAVQRLALSTAHRTVLRTLMQRKTLKKRDLVLLLASWDTGLPMRQLRTAPASLVYW